MRQKYPARIDVRLPEKVREWLRVASTEAARTEAELIRNAIEDMLRVKFPHLEPPT